MWPRATIAVPRGERYEQRVRWHVLAGLCALAMACAGGCESFPPVLTGITIAPSSADGQPQGDFVCRTRLGPPIPAIAVRPGADPGEAGWVLNKPAGDVGITLARGVQNFLLFTTLQESAPYFVVALFMDGEVTPALSAVVSSDALRPLVESRAPRLMGLEGELVPNHSAVSVLRDGYRVSLRKARLPLPTRSFDLVGPWRFVPDGVEDAVGVITIEVQPALAQRG
jgi:hypothetical protein